MKRHNREDLVRKREAESRALMRRLRAAGCPVPAEDDCPRPDLTVAVNSSQQTRAYDFRTSTEYVFVVRITNQSYARLEIQRYKLRLPWPVPNPIWLSDPRVHLPEAQVYRLPSGREFPYDQVLNHRMGKLGTLEPGEAREGVLLAFSILRRISDEYLHGTPFEAELSVFDQYGRRHRSLIEMVADRTATINLEVMKRPRGKGLCDDWLEAGQNDLVSEKVRGNCQTQAGSLETVFDTQDEAQKNL